VNRARPRAVRGSSGRVTSVYCADPARRAGHVPADAEGEVPTRQAGERPLLLRTAGGDKCRAHEPARTRRRPPNSSPGSFSVATAEAARSVAAARLSQRAAGPRGASAWPPRWSTSGAGATASPDSRTPSPWTAGATGYTTTSRPGSVTCSPSRRSRRSSVTGARARSTSRDSSPIPTRHQRRPAAAAAACGGSYSPSSPGTSSGPGGAATPDPGAHCRSCPTSPGNEIRTPS